MKKNKLGSILLIFVLIFGLLPNINSTAATKFSDMPNGWSTKALENSVDNGLLMGSNGLIMPTKNVTRAEMAAMVNRSLGSVKTQSLSAYTDVNSSAWYATDMAKAVHTGIFEGSNGKLNPTMDITRQEAFSVLARTIKLTATTSTALNKFTDAAKVSSWAKNELAAMVSAGYVEGSNGALNPLGKITRAELAQVLDNLINEYPSANETIEKTSSGNIMLRAKNITLKNTTVKGDLIIGGGIEASNVVLDNTIIEGRIIVRGGSSGTITLSNGTKVVDKIIVENNDSTTKITVGTGVSEPTIEKHTQTTVNGITTPTPIDPGDIKPGATYVELGGLKVSIGESTASITSKFGTPTRIDKGLEKYDQYVYNSDYKKYIMIGMINGVVTSIYTSNTSFKLNGNTSFGATSYTSIAGVTYYTDKLDGNKLYGIWVGRDSGTHSGTGNTNMSNNFSGLKIIAETQNLDMLNAFRVKNGLTVLTVDTIAKKTATEHSQDMANNNYFDHTGLDGRSPFQRYDDNNGAFRAHYENIAAGYYSAVDNFDGWLNSSGHRKAMINNTSKYVGIGMGYKSGSQYKFYMTQLFSY